MPRRRKLGQQEAPMALTLSCVLTFHCNQFCLRFLFICVPLKNVLLPAVRDLRPMESTYCFFLPQVRNHGWSKINRVIDQKKPNSYLQKLHFILSLRHLAEYTDISFKEDKWYMGKFRASMLKCILSCRLKWKL